MGVIATSGEMTQYVIDTNWNAIIASATAMNAIMASSTAMNAVAASSTAMNAVAANEPALRAIVNHKAARDALIANNDKLQAVRETMYNTVKNVWTKKVGEKSSTVALNVFEAQVVPKVQEPAASLVFAYLGAHSSYLTSGKYQMQHADGTVAAETIPPSQDPNSMIKVSAVSFGGIKLKSTVNYGCAFVEQYVPN